MHCKYPALLTIGSLALLSGHATHAEERPNVVFILADDLGWNGTSVQMDPQIDYSGSDYYQTPNLEKLAGRGIRFSSAYAAAPICTPSRRSLLYGMTPGRQHGERFPSRFQPAEYQSIPQLLKKTDSRYRTALFGKWGSQMGADPAQVGYDESDGPTDNWVGGMSFPHPESEFLYRIKDDPKKTFSITDRAVSFIQRTAAEQQPFFLHVCYYAVHEDIECRMESLKKYKGRRGERHFNEAYAAMIDDLDCAIGRILDTLDALDLNDNTFIIFTSDNGGEPGYEMGNFKTADLPQNDSLNYPLKNGKGSLFEGGLRVPFIAAGPDIPAGAVCRSPICGWDLLPTLLDLVAAPADLLPSDIDGQSFKSRLLGQPEPARPTLPVFHSPYMPGRKMSVIRSENYKLIHRWDTGENYLFNLSEDLGEHNDLSSTLPEKTEQLRILMTRYLEKVNADIPGEK